jgi:hypothetical protein
VEIRTSSVIYSNLSLHHSMGGCFEGSVSAQWIYCILLYLSSIQNSIKFNMVLSYSDELW